MDEEGDGDLLASDSVVKMRAAYMTFSGSPTLMKSFSGKFNNTMAVMPHPFTATKISDAIETVLTFLDVLDADPMQLCLLCGIVIPNREMKLLKTEGKVVSEVDRYDYVGVGDSSVLRYLAPLLTQTRGYTAKQALNLGVYFVLQAKRYVDGCGGDTDAVILKSDAKPLSMSGAYAIEQRLLLLEHHLNRAGTDFFDGRRSNEEFQESLERLVKTMKDYRPELLR